MGKCLSGLQQLFFLQFFDVRFGGIAEHAFVFAGELGGAFVADMEGGGASVHLFQKHEAPRFRELDSFLELEGGDGCERAEVLVEAGGAHARHA